MCDCLLFTRALKVSIGVSEVEEVGLGSMVREVMVEVVTVDGT
jgi:hypothetical protein